MKAIVALALVGAASATASARGAGERQVHLGASNRRDVGAGERAGEHRHEVYIRGRFGTLCGKLGQHCEHERVTFRALSCTTVSAPPVPHCFEPKSIGMLAGTESMVGGTFGAVGMPDYPPFGLVTGPNADKAHCDNADWLDIEGYTRIDAMYPGKEGAQKKLKECRENMYQLLQNAIDAAELLVTAQNEVVNAQAAIGVTNCDCDDRKASKFLRDGPFVKYAKCKTLCYFGQLLHGSEDMYSHSNWADTEDTSQKISHTNPPGLNNKVIMPFLDLRKPTSEVTVPDGLITGCFDLGPGSIDGAGGNCRNRVSHEALNKDKGDISKTANTISGAKTSRGKIGKNFKHAVKVAVLDTRDKWATLIEGLTNKYGAQRADKMVCALSSDTPMAC
jgi:hypothetical protein